MKLIVQQIQPVTPPNQPVTDVPIVPVVPDINTPYNVWDSDQPISQVMADNTIGRVPQLVFQGLLQNALDKLNLINDQIASASKLIADKTSEQAVLQAIVIAIQSTQTQPS